MELISGLKNTEYRIQNTEHRMENIAAKKISGFN